jgi:hypothetical protein
MLIGYGGYVCSAAITNQSGSGASILSGASNLFDGRSGSGATLKWTNGTQTTLSFVEITVTIVSPFGEASPRQGVAAFINAQGLPFNLKTVIGGVTQRLSYGPRRELCAWALPFANGGTIVMRIYNDDGTVTPPLAAAAIFALGEIFVGRVISLRSLTTGNNPASDIADPTAFQRSAAGQLWQLMRKPYRTCQAQLGRFTASDANGGSASTISDGGNPAGKIDVQTLREFLATTPVCAVCDTPSDPNGSNTTTSGITYNAAFMQGNWQLSRPSAEGQLVMDQPPLWSWAPQFQEAS